MRLNASPYALAMIDALADVSKEAISVAVSALGARSDMVTMLSTGGVIGPLAGMVMTGLAGNMDGISSGSLTEFANDVSAAVVLLMVTLEGVAPLSCAEDLGIEVSIVVLVGVTAEVFVDVLAGTIYDTVPEIGNLADANAFVSFDMTAVLNFTASPPSS